MLYEAYTSFYWQSTKVLPRPLANCWFFLEIALKDWGSGCQEGMYYFQVWGWQNWKEDKLLIYWDFQKVIQGFLYNENQVAAIGTTSKRKINTTENIEILFLLKIVVATLSATLLFRNFVWNCHFSNNFCLYKRVVWL